MARRFSFKRLDALREERGWTWYRFAKNAGARPGNFHAFYFSNFEPKANSLVRLADTLGVPIDDLFEEVEEQLDSDSQESKPSLRRGLTTKQKPDPKRTPSRKRKASS